jgi:hypothetical protein
MAIEVGGGGGYGGVQHGQVEIRIRNGYYLAADSILETLREDSQASDP